MPQDHLPTAGRTSAAAAAAVLEAQQQQSSLVKEQAQRRLVQKAPPSPMMQSMLSPVARQQARKFNSLLLRNASMGVGFVAFSIAVYYYSIHSVTQEDFSDEFLKTLETSPQPPPYQGGSGGGSYLGGRRSSTV